MAHDTLSGKGIEITVDERGRLVRIGNPAAGETCAVSDDGFMVCTDLGTAVSDDLSLSGIGRAAGLLVFRFSGAPFGGVTLAYSLAPDMSFFRRTIDLHGLRFRHGELRLFEVRFGLTRIDRAPLQAIDYRTFFESPTVDFLRWQRGRIFTGIENPFFEPDLAGDAITLSYKPSLVLREGTCGYASQPQFIGVYRSSGVMLQDRPIRSSCGNRQRFFNPSGHVPIDRNESRAMRAFALDYLAPVQDRF